MEENIIFTQVPDLTTQGLGIPSDAEPLVYARPAIKKMVPGKHWHGKMDKANALVRFPRPDLWNGKLLIGGVPAVRTEHSLDLILSDIALQRGYAFAACDKATPGIVLRDTTRSMAEWTEVYTLLTQRVIELVRQEYGTDPSQTYIAGLSNGGYVVRAMMEKEPQLFSGGLEWEGVFWHPERRHIMTTLPVYVKDYPIFVNWHGDRTLSERNAAHERLLDAGLHPQSQPFWDTYLMVYWIVSLWLYGRSLDPTWEPFQADWSNEWLSDASPLADYPWHERLDELARHIQPFANTGKISKPLLSVAGNWDCLIPFEHNARAYAQHVAQQGGGAWHRLYEIQGGNHVDGMLGKSLEGQQPVQPFFEAALLHLEKWVERGVNPPSSGKFQRIEDFVGNADALYSATVSTVTSSDRIEGSS